MFFSGPVTDSVKLYKAEETSWKCFEAATGCLVPRTINSHQLFDPKVDSESAGVVTHDSAQ
jgi:hypothetical protein